MIEQKLTEDMRRLAVARTKLESQLESSSASERGGGGSGSRGDSDRGVSADEERLLAALDLLRESIDDPPSTGSPQPRGRSKSTRLRRQSCMVSSTFTSPGVQRATSVGEAGRIKADRKSMTAAGPRPHVGLSADSTHTTAESDSDNKRIEPTKLSPT